MAHNPESDEIAHNSRRFEGRDIKCYEKDLKKVDIGCTYCFLMRMRPSARRLVLFGGWRKK